MTRALFREGIVVNHKRVRRLMRELGLHLLFERNAHSMAEEDPLYLKMF